MNRYSRQLHLPQFGSEAQQKLQQSKVLVVGAGGLGVPVLQYLAGMGVGTIGIVDDDEISLSNLHRQVLYAEAEIGLPKAEIAAQKLKALNSSIQIQTYPEQLHVDNAVSVIQPYHLVIDATDNFPARYLINDACVMLQKPFVYGAVQQYEGQVGVFNFEGGPTYRCLYPNMPTAGEIPDCNSGGVLGVAPGIIGCYMALEAVKLLSGVGKTLSGSLQTFDFLNGSQYTIKLKAKPENRQIIALQKSYDAPACTTIPHLAAQELDQWIATGKAFTLLDLRDESDFDEGHLEGAQFFSTQILERQQGTVPQHQPVVTFCYRGHRSLQAARYLKEKYPQLPVYHMAAGMDGWLAELGNKHLIYE